MKLGARLTAFLMAAAAAFFAFPLGAFADSQNGQNGQNGQQDRIYHGTYLYLPNFETQSVAEEYYYSDAFFAGSGKDKNEHLRTASFNLVTTGFCSADRETMSSNALDYLKKTGFSTEDVMINDMEQKPQADTLGSVISHKSTPYGEVIAVCTRGARYSLEWIGNFDCGTEGDIHGFATAADKLITRIKDYEQDHDLKGAKLWLVGFSRSGGVCDLAGKYINTHLDEFGISDDDLYVYTFEAPGVSSEKCGYENIHNVFSPADMVPRFYPADWGLSCSGTEEPLAPDIPLINLKTIDLRSLAKGGKDADADPVSLDEFEDRMISFLASCCEREDFAVVGEHLGKLIAVMQDVLNSGVSVTQISSYLKDTFTTWFMVKTGARLLGMMDSDIGSEDYEKDIKALSNSVEEQLEDSDYDGIFTEEQMQTLVDAVQPLLEFALPIIINDYNGEITLSYLGTLVSVGEEVGSQHMSQELFPLVRAQDSYYTEGVDIVPGRASIAGQEFTYEKDSGEDEHSFYSQKGFTDEDIEYIMGGYDVSYDFVQGESVAFEDLDKESRALIEPYLKENGLEKADVLMFCPSFERTRGFDESEAVKLDKSRQVSAVFAADKNNKPGKARLVCINGTKTQEQSCELTAGENGLTAVFDYDGEGRYFLITQPADKTADSAQAAAQSDSGKTVKVIVLVTINLAALAAVVILVVRRVSQR